MTPQAFIAKWRDNPLSEKAGAQSFFLDLCDLLGVVKPNDPDNYCFEHGLSKTGAAHGWADVWKRGAFAWESKAPGKDLGLALKHRPGLPTRTRNWTWRLLPPMAGPTTRRTCRTRKFSSACWR